jgi:hypothetical protein
MQKFAIACAVLVLGLAAASAPAIAAPRDTECIDCPVSDRYDSEELVKKIRKIKQSLANEDPIDIRAGRRGSERKRVAGSRGTGCADCPPPRKYDSKEVVKNVRKIDHSRVINTTTVVPVIRRVKESNRLVVRQNETRHTGVIQHNHTIIEKETRYVRRVPVQTTVEFVTHSYRIVERPDAVSVSVISRAGRECSRGGPGVRSGSCGRTLRVRG